MDCLTLRRGTLRILPLAGKMAEWRRDYQAMREEMLSEKCRRSQVGNRELQADAAGRGWRTAGRHDHKAAGTGVGGVRGERWYL